MLGFSSSAFSQATINTDDLVGTWIAGNDKLFISKDENGSLQFFEIFTNTGDACVTLNISVKDNCMTVDTLFTPNGWTLSSDYVFITKDSLNCEYTGWSEGNVTYYRIK